MVHSFFIPLPHTAAPVPCRTMPPPCPRRRGASTSLTSPSPTLRRRPHTVPLPHTLAARAVLEVSYRFFLLSGCFDRLSKLPHF
jgi:hypothetical protein